MPPTEGKTLSTKPSQIRKRLQRTAKKGNQGRDLQLYMEHALEKPLAEWDLEELARGRPRNKNGGFTHGPRLKWIDPEIQKEIQRRLRDKSLITLRGHIHHAIQVLAKLLDSEDEKVAFNAARLILEYTVGMPQQSVTVEGQVTIATMLAKALVLPGGEDAHPIIQGEFTETDNELEDEDDEL